jgi:GNAT superfamily N-acetyltransferase
VSSADPAPVFAVHEATARPLTPRDDPALQALLERAADYTELLTGLPPGSSDAQSLYAALPEGKAYEDKLVLGVHDPGGFLIGVFDVIRDYPVAGTWLIGLLLLDPKYRRQGLGRRLFEGFARWSETMGASVIRIGVAEHNPDALRFWTRLGFHELERTEPRKFGNREGRVVVMRLDLSTPRRDSN